MSKAVEQEKTDHGSSEVWGVLGGMGPLASAEFMKSIYEQNTGGKEQNSPIVFLLSDPSIPDRTESLHNGTDKILLARLSSGISQLISAGATKIVMCCVTAHYLMSQLPAPMRAKIVSLVDLIFAAILQGGEKSLLLCTEGARAVGIFQTHEAWCDAQNFVVLPDRQDQASVHQLIYEIKSNHTGDRQLRFIQSLMRKYGVSSYTAGCTELHILAREQARVTGRKACEFCVDPLAIVAAMMSHAAPYPELARASISSSGLNRAVSSF